MKRIIALLILVISFSSCGTSPKEWSEKDKDTFMRDCLSVDKSLENKERCECGLNVMMNKYKSLKEAQEAVHTMDSKELEELLKDCVYY